MLKTVRSLLLSIHKNKQIVKWLADPSRIEPLRRVGQQALRRYRSPNAWLLPFWYRSDLYLFMASSSNHDVSTRSTFRETLAPELRQHLSQLSRRLRWQRSVILLTRSLLLATVALVLGAVSFSLGVPAVEALTQAIALAAFLMGLALALFQRIDDLETAKVIDRIQGLKERLATAVEYSKEKNLGQLARAQALEAQAVAAQLRPSAVLPYRLPRHDLRSLALAASLFAGLSLLNASGWTISSLYPGLQDAAQAVAPPPVMAASRGDTHKDLWNDEPTSSQPSGLSAPVEDQSVKTEQRIVKAGAVPGELERQSLDSAAADLAQSLDQQNPERAADAIQNLAKQVGQLSPSAKQELAADARQAASQVGNQNPDLAQKLSNLADALSSGDNNAVDKALSDLRNESQPNQAAQASNQKQVQAQSGSKPNPADQQGSEKAAGQQDQGQQSDQTKAQDGQSDQSRKQAQNGQSPAAGAGNAPGQRTTGELHRLDGQGKQLSLTGQQDKGDSSFQRLNTPSSPRAGDVQSSQSAGNGWGSSQPVGLAADSNYVPWNLKDLVRNYFSSGGGQ